MMHLHARLWFERDASELLRAVKAGPQRCECVSSAENNAGESIKRFLPATRRAILGELPTPVRAALVQAEKPEAEQRNLLAADGAERLRKKAIRAVKRRRTGSDGRSGRTLRLELFGSSGYPVYARDERDRPTGGREAVLQSVVIEGDSGSNIPSLAERHLSKGTGWAC